MLGCVDCTLPSGLSCGFAFRGGFGLRFGCGVGVVGGFVWVEVVWLCSGLGIVLRLFVGWVFGFACLDCL